MFEGTYTAIVTPFSGGKLDEARYEKLIEFQIANGVDGLVPCGTTGESATLSHEEHERVIQITVETVRKRVKVLAGSGSNSTEEAIRLTKYAKRAGADGALLITPYYNKPTQEGIYRHFEAVARVVDIPLVMYNVPGRTGVNMLPSTVVRCAKIANIVGIKEAAGNVTQASDIIEAVKRDDFDLLSGDDFIVYPLMAIGAKGVISVVSNVAPKLMADLTSAVKNGDHTLARKLHFATQELSRAMFLETNPIPVKTALAMMGMMKEEFRLPLTPMAAANREILKQILTKEKVSLADRYL